MRRSKKGFREHSRRVSRNPRKRIAKALPLRLVANVETLEERNLLAAQALASVDGVLQEDDSTNPIRMIVDQNSGSTIIGMRMHATSGDLDPGVPKLFRGNTQISPEFTKANVNGSDDSILFAEVSDGDYTIIADGDGGTGNYRLEVFVLGDSNADGMVSEFEYLTAGASQVQDGVGGNHVSAHFFKQMGINFDEDLFDDAFDSNANGRVDDIDLERIAENKGDAKVGITLIGDLDAPVIEAELTNDTGNVQVFGTFFDTITSDAGLSGSVTDESEIEAFQLSVDGGEAIDVQGFVANTAFSITFSELNALLGEDLTEGFHTYTFSATDQFGNSVNTGAFNNFTLDTIAPIDLDLADASDSGESGDTLTDVTPVTFEAMSNEESTTTLTPEGESAIDPDTPGSATSFTFTDVDLPFGPSDFTLTATDLAGNVRSLTRTFTRNSAPTVDDQIFDIDENSDEDTLVGTVPAADPDLVALEPEESLSYAIIDGNTDNAFKIDSESGDIRVNNPDAINFEENPVFILTVEVTDSGGDGQGGEGLTDMATVAIEVNNINDAPVAEDVSGDADEDGDPINVSYDADDADNDDDPSSLTYMLLSQPSEGSAIDNGDGTFTFDPGSDFQDLAVGETRDVTFAYKATDSHEADSNTATVTITVTGVNDLPVAKDITRDADEDGDPITVMYDADDIDSDDDSSTLTYMLLSQPSEGSAIDNGDGTFTFDPGADFQDLAVGQTRDVTFTYKATDSHTADSNTAMVTITVTGVNDAPVAEDVSGDADEDGDPITVSYDADDADSDDDSSSLTYMLLSQPSEGSAIDNGDGTFSFDPGSDFQDLAMGETRDVTFTYKATDSHTSDSNAATATITVTGVNDAPVAEDVSGDADENGDPITVSYDADDIDSDDDPSSLTYMLLSQPSEGSAIDNGDGTFSFDPGSDFQDLAAGETQDVTFTYKATDTHGTDTNTATVTITVTGENTSPVAEDVSGDADEDGDPITVSYDADDADSDDDSSTLTYMLLSQPSEGSAMDNGDGTFSFDPGSDFQDLAMGETRDVTFTYKATDSHTADSNTATATITVTGENDAPVVDDQSFAVNVNAESNDSLGTVAASDPEMDDLTFVIESGNVGSESDELFAIDPDTGEITVNNPALLVFEDVHMLTVSVTDDGSPSLFDTAVITITVTDNFPPLAQDVTGDADEDGDPITVSYDADDLDNDDDPSTLTYMLLSQPSEGSAIDNGDGTFSFDPGNDFQNLALDETRDVSFTYKATDSHGADSNTAMITISVTGVNDAPVAQDVTGDADEDGDPITVSYDADDVDSDDDSSTLTYMLLSQPSEGSAIDNGDGTFSFDPGSDFQDLAMGETRDVTFTYKATDTHTEDSNTATATITVTGVNASPVAEDVSGDADEDGDPITVSYDADDSDSDDDSSSLTYMLLSQPSEGSAMDNGDGTFSFDPGSDFQDLAMGETRDVTFTYKATDSHTADSNTATATITVTGVNDAPVAEDVSGDAENVGDPINVSYDADDVDSDDDSSTLTYMLLSQPSAGSASDNGDGTFSFDPGSDFNDLELEEPRDVTFTYKATDTHTADSNTATITITVTGANTSPVAQDVSGDADEDGDPINVSYDADDDDSDDDPSTLTYMVLSQPSEGSASDNGDGSFSFDPGSDFQDLAVEETRDVTFTYKATDSHGTDSNTATATITVTGVNDDPTVENEIPDQTTPLDKLFEFDLPAGTFDDVDTSDVLTFTATLEGGDPLPEWLSFDGSGFSGTPGQSDVGTIDVKVTADDGNGGMVSDTFQISVADFEIALVVRETTTPESEFDVFVVNTTIDGAGVGRLELVINGSNQLDYSFFRLESFDFDSSTPETTDDVVSITIQNDGSDVFAVPTGGLSPDGGELFGSWTEGDGFDQTQIDALRAGDISVNIQTDPGSPTDQKLGLSNFSPSAEMFGLPSSIDEILTGQNYVVEVWAIDHLDTSMGISSLEVMVDFDSNLTVGDPNFSGSEVELNGPFTDLANATFDTSGDTTTATLSAGAVFSFTGTGLSPTYARLGTIHLQADAGGIQDFDVSLLPPGIDHLPTRSGVGQVPEETITFTNRSVEQIEPQVFDIVAATNVVMSGTVNGITLVPQSAGADMTSATGTIDVVIDDLDAPSTIRFASSEVALSVNDAGEFLPTDPSSSTDNFGFTFNTTNTAIRNLITDIMSDGAINIGAGGIFSTSSTTWTLLDGALDLPGAISTDRNDLTGLEAMEDSSSDATISEDASTITLTIPFTRTISFSIQEAPIELDITGELIAEFTKPASLFGNEVAERDGTSVSLRLSESPTDVDETGQVEALPSSETWIDEWDAHYVEIWVDTTDGPGIHASSVNLDYNGDQFTATDVEYGPAFAGSNATIDDAAGTISGISGVALAETAGADGYALLARVKFEALAGDNVVLDSENLSIGPHDLGLRISAAQVDVSGVDSVEVKVGGAPRTELWAVPYDMNDDGKIGFADMSIFSGSFLSDTLSADTPFAGALDFNNDGTIGFADFSLFSSNFLLSKASGGVTFPETFRQRWVGLGLDATGETDPGDVFDTALATWQDALEIDQNVEIDLVVRNFGDNQLGSAEILEVDANGVPTRGRVTLDDDANGLGWFSDLDAAPEEGRYDLYTVALHEIGHVLGFTQAHSGFASNVDDTTYVGSDFSAELEGDHLAEAQHQDDLMNATLSPGERRLPSALDALIIQAAHTAGSVVTENNTAAQFGTHGVASGSIDAVADQLPRYGTAPTEDQMATLWNLAVDGLAVRLAVLPSKETADAILTEQPPVARAELSFDEQVVWQEIEDVTLMSPEEASDEAQADYLDSLEDVFAELGDSDV